MAALAIVACGQNVTPVIPSDKAVEAKVEKVLKGMTLQEKAGQIVQINISALLGADGELDPAKLDKVIGEYSRSIKSSGKMLLMLVNDVLDFSKIEAGKLEIIESRFLMSEMLYDVVSLVKERADEKKLVFKVEITLLKKPTGILLVNSA